MFFISFHQLRPAEIKIVSCSIYFFYFIADMHMAEI